MVGSNLDHIRVVLIERKGVTLYIEVDLELKRPVVGHVFVERVGLVRPVVDGLQHLLSDNAQTVRKGWQVHNHQ